MAVVTLGDISLGRYEFDRSSPRDKRRYHGQFDLWVRVSGDLNAAQQRTFHDAEKRLRQTTEITLRRLRVADLTDPRLMRMTDKLQESLNDELGFDGIAEVMIANFKVEAAAPPAPPPPANASPHAQQPARKRTG